MLLTCSPARAELHRRDAREPAVVDAQCELDRRLNRVDRFPYLLARWRGPISTVMFVNETEVEKAFEFIFRHRKYPITFTLYIVHNMGVNPYFFAGTKRVYFDKGLYPYNVLRNIGIESISTTHYLLVDIDVFPSTNLYDSFMRQADLLSDPSNVVLFQLFQYTNAPANQCKTYKCNYQLCVWAGEITRSWNIIPTDKAGLIPFIQNKRMMKHFNVFQVGAWRACEA